MMRWMKHLSDSKFRLQIIELKIVITFVLIIVGLTVIIIGGMNFYKTPVLQKELPFNGIISKYENSGLDIKFTSSIGLMPNMGIISTIKVTAPELTKNTTSIEVIFSGGVVRNNNEGISREGNPIKLQYQKTESNQTIYTGESYLIYYVEGTYGAKIQITPENELPIINNFENVIRIGSWETYVSQIKQNNSEGIAWVVTGIAMISTASTFSKLLDWGYEHKILKKKVFYE